MISIVVRSNRRADLAGPIQSVLIAKRIASMNDQLVFSEQTAVLLIAHGSRRPEANQDLVQLAKMIGSQGRYDLIEVSYLELASPTILEGGRRCVEQGAKRVLMFPYFLSAGVHVVTDLNEIRDQLAAEFPDVKFILCHHLGLHPLMTELVMLRLSEADR